ncbi:MAG TPA: 5-oxoprolinase subunit PxpA, partial [Micromonosporaceae bacterium]
LSELRDEIIYQIAALDGFCRIQGGKVRFVKPHGALYNTAAVDEWQASAIVAAIIDFDKSLPVLCQPNSILASAATRAGIQVVGEGYADRAYQRDGTLVPRTLPGAVIKDPDVVAARAFRLASAGEVVAEDGSLVRCPVQSLCLHGDTPGAVELARRLRDSLTNAGVDLGPFVPMR